MLTFVLHRLDWLMVSKRFSWNVKYETIYGWFASFTIIYTIPRVRNYSNNQDFLKKLYPTV